MNAALFTGLFDCGMVLAATTAVVIWLFRQIG